MAAAAADASGRLQYEDRPPAVESTRYYRLREPSASVAIDGSLITVTSAPTRFAIDGPLQNPVAGEIVVRVELPPGTARLGLFDLAGRKLRERQVTGSGLVSLGGANGLSAGVYLLRLSQGARLGTSRVCIVH